MDYNKINTKKLKDTKQLLNVLASYHEETAKISKFQSAVEQLTANYQKSEALYALLTKDTTSIEDAKSFQRNTLIKKVLPVITVMQIFAFDKGKKKMLKRLELLSSENLHKSTDIELIKTTKKVWEISNKYGSYSLAFLTKIKSSVIRDKSKAVVKLEKEYGLLPEMIKDLEEANIKFIESLLFYNDEMSVKSDVVNKVKKVGSQTSSLIENQIDRFVLLFEDEVPKFYNEYRKVRNFSNSEFNSKHKIDENLIEELEVSKATLSKEDSGEKD